MAEISVGDRFRSRDTPLMVATVTALTQDGLLAFVRRNTSRRRQPIQVRRLLDPNQYARLRNDLWRNPGA